MKRAFLLFLAGFFAAASPLAAQTTDRPAPYRAVEVSFGVAGTTLGGTLTIPEHPLAAVVLLPGSGPGGRDAAIGSHKPFAVAADYLARHDVASLRTDSRGVGKSSGTYYDATGDTLAADAIAAIQMLRARPEMRGVPIGLVGHSLGGVIATLAAARSPLVSFVVLLSSPARPDIENTTDRVTAQLRDSGTAAAEIDAVLQAVRRVNANPDAPGVRADVLALMKATTGGLVPPDQLGAVVDQAVIVMRSPWGRSFASLDPRDALRGVRCPVLAVAGSLDRVVTPAANVQQMHEVMLASGNPDATVIEMQGINHWLQTARTGAPTEIGQLQEAISPRLLALMTGWVRAHGIEPDGGAR